MQIPGVVKVVVNMGVGDAARDAKLINGPVNDLWITGEAGDYKPASRSRSSSCVRHADRRAGGRAATGCGSSWTG